MLNRLLFLIEKYCDADPKCGPTNAESMVVAAVKSTGLVGETKTFYYDQVVKSCGWNRMTELLLEDVDIFQPEAIIYTPMGGLLGTQINPLDGWLDGSAELYQALKRRGVRIYSHLWDTIGREEETRQRCLPVTDFCGDVASNAERFGDETRMLQVYSAVDSAVFFDQCLKRDIDVSFIGSVDPSGQRWPQRTVLLNYLKQHGVDVVIAGGQRGARLEWPDYAKLLCRSKVSLNFSIDPVSGTSQIKGRVFESLACGAMLLEDEGTQTDRFFRPEQDFARFHFDLKHAGPNPEFYPGDLLEKVKYFLADEKRRRYIAGNGYYKLNNLYNPYNMWGYIFEKMGFAVPEIAEFATHRAVLDKIRAGGKA